MTGCSEFAVSDLGFGIGVSFEVSRLGSFQPFSMRCFRNLGSHRTQWIRRGLAAQTEEAPVTRAVISPVTSPLQPRKLTLAMIPVQALLVQSENYLRALTCLS